MAKRDAHARIRTGSVESGLGGQAARGAAVTLGAQGIRTLVQMASVVILARILFPADYGLVAMAMAVVGIGELFRDFGLSSAAIQASSLSKEQRDNLFWVNTGIGLVLALMALGAAGLIAGLYSEPRLIGVVQALSITFLLNGLATQHRASLTRQLAFRSLALVDVTAPVLAFGASLAVALLDGGYWAIVMQLVVNALATLILSVMLGGWLPGLPHRKTSIRPMLKYGGNLVGSQLLGYLANNIDTFVIGFRFGPSALGFYNRSFQLLMRPLSQIRAPATTVALPVLSRVKDEESRFNKFVRSGQLALGLPLAVGLAVIVGAAYPVIEVFLGRDWLPSAPILQLLAIAAFFDTLAFVGYWVYLSRGLTNELFKFSAISAVIRITTVLLGSLWGPVGVAAGFALQPIITWPLSLWWLGRVTIIPKRDLYSGAGRLIGQAVPVAITTYIAVQMTSGAAAWMQLLVASAAGLVISAGIIFSIPALRRDLQDVVSIGRLALKQRTTT